MTPLEAFLEDIDALFDEYRHNQITVDEAVFRLSERADVLRQAYITSDISDETLKAIFEKSSELRILAYEKGDMDEERVLLDIHDMAETTFFDPEARQAEETRMQAELVWSFPSPEAA